MSQARLREALSAGGPATGAKDKGPPVADGVLSVTPDTPEAQEWKNRQSPIDIVCASSPYLDEPDDGRSLGVVALLQSMLVEHGPAHKTARAIAQGSASQQLFAAKQLVGVASVCIAHVLHMYSMQQQSMLASSRTGAGPSSPGDLYGKFTWRIEKFSEISKRELRSTVFEVGNYKWYGGWGWVQTVLWIVHPHINHHHTGTFWSTHKAVTYAITCHCFSV